MSTVVAATDILSLDEHCLETDDEVTFRTENGTPPSPLVEGTTYYAIPLTDGTFKVSLTAGGSAVNLTTAGSNVLLCQETPFADFIETASSMVEERLTGHAVPITGTVPVSVEQCTAVFACELALEWCGQPTVGIQSKKSFAIEQLNKWARGVSIRGTNSPPKANLASVVLSSSNDPRGWGTSDGGIP